VELVVSLFLIAFGALGVVSSLQLELPGGWATAPGLTGLILSFGLIGMSGAVAIKSLSSRRSRGLNSSTDEIAAFPDVDIFRVVFILVMFAIFAFALCDYFSFEVATFLYLMPMLSVFWPKSTAVRCIAVSAIAPIIFVIVFELAFGIPLPGDSLLLR